MFELGQKVTISEDVKKDSSLEFPSQLTAGKNAIVIKFIKSGEWGIRPDRCALYILNNEGQKVGRTIRIYVDEIQKTAFDLSDKLGIDWTKMRIAIIPTKYLCLSIGNPAQYYGRRSRKIRLNENTEI